MARWKRNSILSALLLALLATSGCVTQRGEFGRSKTMVLGGLITREKGSYLRQGPLTIGAKSSELSPSADLDGDSTSLLWGLITYVDE